MISLSGRRLAPSGRVVVAAVRRRSAAEAISAVSAIGATSALPTSSPRASYVPTASRRSCARSSSNGPSRSFAACSASVACGRRRPGRLDREVAPLALGRRLGLRRRTARTRRRACSRRGLARGLGRRPLDRVDAGVVDVVGASLGLGVVRAVGRSCPRTSSRRTSSSRQPWSAVVVVAASRRRSARGDQRGQRDQPLPGAHRLALSWCPRGGSPQVGRDPSPADRPRAAAWRAQSSNSA